LVVGILKQPRCTVGPLAPGLNALPAAFAVGNKLTKLCLWITDYAPTDTFTRQ